MSKNGDIRGFFAKGAPSRAPPPKASSASSVSPASPPAAERAHQPTPTPSSQLSIDLPSSPFTPQKQPVKTPLTRDDEIRGSDDEDDDSDSSLESLGELLGRRSGPATYQRPTALMTTPKAKRIAPNSFHRSPLTLQQQPTHKFDLKSLIKHARQDDATEQSARRADELRVKADQEELEAGRDMADKARDVFGGEDGEKGDKLARAIDRTVGDESRPRCYFFALEDEAAAAGAGPRRPFPKKAAKVKPWTLLQDSKTRDQMFIRGMVSAVAAKGKELPDEIYRWILDEICIEENLQLRNQYIRSAALCCDDTRRLVDERQLYKMLEKIGGQKHETSKQKFELSPGLQDPYSRRDWSPLRHFLQLLAEMAPNLTSKNATSAVQLLLRLSLDPVVDRAPGVRAEYAKAMVALESALPTPEDQWDTCCKKICNYLYQGVDQVTQRHIATVMLPTSTPRLADLQRRLATVALFDDPGLGAIHPDESVTMQDLFARLGAKDFRVRHSTDFDELNALLSLFDMVLDRGSQFGRAYLSTTPLPPPTPQPRLAPVLPTPASSTSTTTAASTATTPSPRSEAEAAALFDADVDRLRAHLKALHDKIADNSLVSSKVAKASLDGMMKRLAFTVRSRPPPKSSIFDEAIYGREKEDAHLPRQRDFMKKWSAASKGGGVKKDEGDDNEGAA
ncbi:hypothetical protein JX266_001457 [Neoarthrinium moseri]|nr:hypothetical protein JX266_001457 [Neoarthrinium moseri]